MISNKPANTKNLVSQIKPIFKSVIKEISKMENEQPSLS